MVYEPSFGCYYFRCCYCHCFPNQIAFLESTRFAERKARLFIEKIRKKLKQIKIRMLTLKIQIKIKLYLGHISGLRL